MTTPAQPWAKRDDMLSTSPTGPTDLDELDGLTISLADGAWFNVRASNTEPLLRLNVEAPDPAGHGRDARRGAGRDP